MNLNITVLVGIVSDSKEEGFIQHVPVFLKQICFRITRKHWRNVS